MKRTTVCNNIDTMNTMLLRGGKPRIFVQSISQNGKIDRDVFGEPLDGADPDAMLELFCSKLAPGEMPLQIGKQVDLMNDKTFLRCMVKAMQTRERNAISKQVEQLSATVEQGLRERQEIEAQNAELRVAVGALEAANTELRLAAEANAGLLETLQTENAELRAALEAKTTEAEAAAGAKRLRTANDDMLASVQKMESMMCNLAFMQKNAEMAQQIIALQNDLNAQAVQLNKARMERDRYKDKAFAAQADNVKKAETIAKLSARCKKTTTTLRSGTRVFTNVIAARDSEGCETLPVVVDDLRRCIQLVSRNQYLRFVNAGTGVLPHDQTSLDNFVMGDQAGGDDARPEDTEIDMDDA